MEFAPAIKVKLQPAKSEYKKEQGMTETGRPKTTSLKEVPLDNPRLNEQGGAGAAMTTFPVIFRFRLYIAGGAPNSLQAIYNLSALCREHLADRHYIENVDVLLEPNRALADGILLTPTLLRFLPEPALRIVGTLGDTRSLLQAFGLPVSPL